MPVDAILPPDLVLKGVHSRKIELEEPFEIFAGRFADTAGCVLLLSGAHEDGARYHMLGIEPWLRIVCHGRKVTWHLDGRKQQTKGDSLDLLAGVVQQLALPEKPARQPISAGLMGYLAYDLKDQTERLPHTSMDDLLLPGIYMAAPSVLVVHDKYQQETWLHIPLRSDWRAEDVDRLQARFQERLQTPARMRANTVRPCRLHSCFTHAQYLRAVETVREYIRAGDIYQANLSQRFQTDFDGDAYALFCQLYQANPAPFFAYVHAGDHQIVSTSPERFLLRQGSYVETRPIKGTRPRKKDPKRDAAMRKELSESPKDDAELSMIVDLLRNDIGKVCRQGSVKVSEHKRLEAYQNVYHLVSIVKGELDHGKNSIDLIRATFPGGSITGCPKIRAMEIIDELEPNRRHIYTGSIGYISFHDSMDLSIAIRTATVVGGKMLFSVGGGIVYDSDPQSEYEETLHKGASLMGALKGGPDDRCEESSAVKVWLSGVITDAAEAAIAVSDLAVQYGYGIFETLRADGARVGHLDAHLQRLAHSWQALFGTSPPDIDWSEVIRSVLKANGLTHGCAAVKIMATRGSRNQPPYDHQLVVTARAYTHRLCGKSAPGLHLAAYPESRQSPLAAHKTLNYLYYYLSGEWARQNGCDEALIFNPDGSVSETHTANILLLAGNEVIRPLSPAVLPGVMAAQVCRKLAEQGMVICDKMVYKEDLFAADGVWVTNSLMGAIPALSLDGRAISGQLDAWQQINRELLAADYL